MDFNHAMIYSANVPQALVFYRDVLGFEVIETWGDGYARLKSPSGSTSIGLPAIERENRKMDVATEGIRLYFEVMDLDETCKRMEASGVRFDQMPKDMPWGWRHAYLRDPDGHEISLYRAGEKRLQKTVMER